VSCLSRNLPCFPVALSIVNPRIPLTIV
jgi:hypothetical protein